jgi:hypothetical protein
LADDQNEQAQPDASQESTGEIWWQNYIVQVNKSIVAAEQHLEVPAGTVSSIPFDPDFISTVKIYAVVEPILNDLIASWQQPPQTSPYQALSLLDLGPLGQSARENFRAFVAALNIRGPTGKLKLAKGLGLLTEDRTAFIHAVAQVRNRYAHNVKNMHRSLTDIVTEEQRTNGRIVEHLTGIKLALSPNRNDVLKLLMYYRLADYLSDALQTLRPPPPPSPENGIPWTSLTQLYASMNKPK